jgi:hypothetical protein
MARRFQLPDADQVVVMSERDSHPCPIVRRKMLVVWAVHTGLTNAQAGGLEGLRHRDVVVPISALAEHAETIKASLTEHPVRTVAEAAERIKQLTGLERGLTQTRVFLKGLGFTWQRTRAVPVPPKSRWPNMSPINGSS